MHNLCVGEQPLAAPPGEKAVEMVDQGLSLSNIER
jgi:hypothetical protein